MQVDGVEHRAQAQDDVGPALAAGRAMVEFAEAAAVRGFFGEAFADADGGQAVEDAEFALAQALVDDPSGPVRRPARPSCKWRRQSGAPEIGRRQDDLRPLGARQSAQTSGPAASACS